MTPQCQSALHSSCSCHQPCLLLLDVPLNEPDSCISCVRLTHVRNCQAKPIQGSKQAAGATSYEAMPAWAGAQRTC